ncbi:KH domain-containing protein [Bdellovibrio bacteriovorus]
MLANNVADQNEVRDRLAAILKGVIQEMTSCPHAIEVSYAMGDKTTIYKVDLPQEFRGKLIGAQGKNITALRNIIAAMGGNHGFRAIIELVV